MKIIILFGPSDAGKSHLVSKFNEEHPDKAVRSVYEFPESYTWLMEVPHTLHGEEKTFVFELSDKPSDEDLDALLMGSSGHCDVHNFEVVRDLFESIYQQFVDAILT